MKRDISLKSLGNSIRELRTKKDWSQEDLAEKADLHRNYMSSVERGERNVSLKNIIKIADAFGIRASDLLKRAAL